MNIRRKTLNVIFFMLFFNFFSFGQTLYKNNVTASYYAEAFHGKRTSNGEYFNMYELTCAHKTLPFNTILKVTNLSNKRSVQVRVNDRGPFVKGREIDLSKAAAIELKMIGTGTAKVKLEIIKLGPNTKLSQQTAASAVKIMAKKGETISTAIPQQVKQGTSTSSKPSNNSKTVKLTPGTYWDIQLGAFSSKENATKYAQKIIKAGFKDVVLQKSGDITRVALRNIPAEKVRSTEKKLVEKGFNEYTIKQRKSK